MNIHDIDEIYYEKIVSLFDVKNISNGITGFTCHNANKCFIRVC